MAFKQRDATKQSQMKIRTFLTSFESMQFWDCSTFYKASVECCQGFSMKFTCHGWKNSSVRAAAWHAEVPEQQGEFP